MFLSPNLEENQQTLGKRQSRTDWHLASELEFYLRHSLCFGNYEGCLSFMEIEKKWQRVNYLSVEQRNQTRS